MTEENKFVKKLDSTFKMLDKDGKEYTINKYLVSTIIGGETTGTHIIENKEYETSDGEEVFEKNSVFTLGSTEIFLPS